VTEERSTQATFLFTLDIAQEAAVSQRRRIQRSFLHPATSSWHPGSPPEDGHGCFVNFTPSKPWQPALDFAHFPFPHVNQPFGQAFLEENFFFPTPHADQSEALPTVPSLQSNPELEFGLQPGPEAAAARLLVLP